MCMVLLQNQYEVTFAHFVTIEFLYKSVTFPALFSLICPGSEICLNPYMLTEVSAF